MSDTITATAAKSSNKALPPPPADPYLEPAQYLLSKGWRPRGDVRSQHCHWLDPTKPLQETSELRRVEIGTELDGRTKKYVEQLYVTPGVRPVPLNEALSVQYERDEMEALAGNT